MTVTNASSTAADHDRRVALPGQRRHLRRRTAPATVHASQPPSSATTPRSDELRQRLRQRHLHPVITIAAANDIIVAPTTAASVAGRQPVDLDADRRQRQLVLGLIANNFVRVDHRVTRDSSCTSTDSPTTDADLTIDAAILSLAPLVHRRQLRLRHASSATLTSTARSPRSTAARSARPAAPASPRTTSTTTACTTAARRTS